MTDLEDLKMMLRRANIPFLEKPGMLVIRVGESFPEPKDRVEGYLNFYTELIFTPGGSLEKVGIWEGGKHED